MQPMDDGLGSYLQWHHPGTVPLTWDPLAILPGTIGAGIQLHKVKFVPSAAEIVTPGSQASFIPSAYGPLIALAQLDW